MTTVLEPLAWKLHVVRRDGCIVHGRESAILAERYDPASACELPLQGAHAVSQQHLRKRGLSHLAWHPGAGFGCCYRAHTRHDNRIQPIPFELLPQACIGFAVEHDLLHLLERYFPKEKAA